MRIASIGVVVVACALAVVAAQPARAQNSGVHSPELFKHIANGESKTAQAMLENDPKLLKAEGPGYIQPLAAAAQAGLADLVKYCLEKGANINHATTTHQTALHYAVDSGKPEIVAMLLEKKPDLNAVGNYYHAMQGLNTPLCRAVYILRGARYS